MSVVVMHCSEISLQHVSHRIWYTYNVVWKHKCLLL